MPNAFQSWIERLKASCERAHQLTDGLSEEQLNWKENPDRWSVAQCLDHLANGVDEYLAPLRPKLEGATALMSADELVPKHTFLGRQIVKAVSPQTTSTMKSPKIFAPTSSDISGDVVERFMRVHEELMALIASAEGIDINRVRMSSPVAWFFRINVTDAFEILVAHPERHLNQAERVIANESFPK